MITVITTENKPNLTINIIIFSFEFSLFGALRSPIFYALYDTL